MLYVCAECNCVYGRCAGCGCGSHTLDAVTVTHIHDAMTTIMGVHTKKQDRNALYHAIIKHPRWRAVVGCAKAKKTTAKAVGPKRVLTTVKKATQKMAPTKKPAKNLPKAGPRTNKSGLSECKQ